MQGCLRRQIGRNIAALREQRGWRQKELAPRLGVTRSGLSKWESGEHPPSVEALVKMAEVLEVTLDELVRGRPGAESAGLGPAERGVVERAVRNLSRLLGRPETSRRN
jgi:transcriptional regulator with XRE-family HTH domain